jgi:hypothetical protein
VVVERVGGRLVGLQDFQKKFFCSSSMISLKSKLLVGQPWIMTMAELSRSPKDR